MKDGRRTGWLGGLACLLVCVAVLWFSRNHQPPQPAGGTAQVVARPGPLPKQEAPTDEADDFSARETSDRETILRDWQELGAWLRGTPAPTDEAIRARLEELRDRWVTLDPQVLAETLRGLLDSKDDLPTGLAFKVGSHGFLEGWPTLRVFLLDVLAAADPEAAAAIAKKTLDTTASADEYAVALRPLAHPGPGRADDGELLRRFATMLGHAGWEKQPGFAEAFDVVRAIGSPEAGRELAAWTGNPVLRNMALEELAAAHPASIVPTVVSDEGAALDGIIRSNLMARIDPADPAQLAAADAYLRNPDLPADEAANFLQVFPLRSATTGQRLYGEAPAPYDHAGIAAGDRAALDQVTTWLAEPDLAKYRARMEPLQSRLAGWVKQAAAN